MVQLFCDILRSRNTVLIAINRSCLFDSRRNLKLEAHMAGKVLCEKCGRELAPSEIIQRQGLELCIDCCRQMVIEHMQR
jgi:hypothetical protein